MHNNFIVANYAADGGCLDNDDGSSYYHIHHNFCVYGGHKCDFDGNKKISSDNVHAFPSVYGTTCLNIGAQSLPPEGYAEGYYNNKCVLPTAGASYLKIGGVAGPPNPHGGEWPSTRPKLDCLSGEKGGAAYTAFNAGITLGSESARPMARPMPRRVCPRSSIAAAADNSLYVPGGNATITCGSASVDFATFQAKGYDSSSTIAAALPSNDTIIGWAKELLSMS